MPLRRPDEASELRANRRAFSGPKAVALALAVCFLVSGVILFLMMPVQGWDLQIGNYRLVGTRLMMVTQPLGFSYRPSGAPGVLFVLGIGDECWICIDNNRVLVAADPNAARKH